MKNIKKIFAIIISAAAALSAGTIQVSAESEVTAGTYTEPAANIYKEPEVTAGIYKVEGNNNNYFPVFKKVTKEYKGILVKMPDGAVPENGIPGLENCDVKPYNEKNMLELINGQYGNVVQVSDADNSKYFISEKDIAEENAEETVKKLKINGTVESADLLYYTYPVTSYMDYDENTVSAIVTCSNDSYDDAIYHAPEESEKELFGFKEFSEAGFTVNKLYKKRNYISYVLNYDGNMYENSWELYLELIKVCDKIKENNSSDENFDNADIKWITPVSDVMETKLYSPELLWGDATNDNVIDLYDAIEIAKYLIGKSTAEDIYIKLADINRDGKTDLYDAIEIARNLIMN